jgi:hypothetical protein
MHSIRYFPHPLLPDQLPTAERRAQVALTSLRRILQQLGSGTDTDAKATPYTGTAGKAYAFWALSRIPAVHEAAPQQQEVKRCIEYAQRALSHERPPHHLSSFLDGAAGTCAVGALCYSAAGMAREADQCVERFNALQAAALS